LLVVRFHDASLVLEAEPLCTLSKDMSDTDATVKCTGTWHALSLPVAWNVRAPLTLCIFFFVFRFSHPDISGTTAWPGTCTLNEKLMWRFGLSVISWYRPC